MTERNPASTTGEIVDDASTLPTVVPAPTEPVPAEALPVQHDPTDAIHATDPAATADAADAANRVDVTDTTPDAVPEPQRAPTPMPVSAPPRPVSNSPGLKSPCGGLRSSLLRLVNTNSQTTSSNCVCLSIPQLSMIAPVIVA